jgi:hypothetical protein
VLSFAIVMPFYEQTIYSLYTHASEAVLYVYANTEPACLFSRNQRGTRSGKRVNYSFTIKGEHPNQSFWKLYRECCWVLGLADGWDLPYTPKPETSLLFRELTELQNVFSRALSFSFLFEEEYILMLVRDISISWVVDASHPGAAAGGLGSSNFPPNDATKKQYFR